MNRIEAVLGKSEYVDEQHLQIQIDGEFLDRVLAEKSSEILGLIPTTLGWLRCPKEQGEVWRRFSRRNAKRVLVPILCCPDDLDFSCSVVVVDVQFDREIVKWLKFGYDATSFDRLPDAIGSVVSWLPEVGPFCFDRDDYEKVVQTFEKLKSHQNTE